MNEEDFATERQEREKLVVQNAAAHREIDSLQKEISKLQQRVSVGLFVIAFWFELFYTICP